jgi:epoxyqueuosine reductase
MHYLSEREAAYEHPRSVLAGVRSVLMLAMNYKSEPAVAPRSGQGRLARYAWGEADYHDLIHRRLKQLAASFHEWVPRASVRGVVDTAPLLEREFAQLAGLGWIGKNTLLLNKSMGSWFFLAALLTDQVLEYDVPYETDHCGTCRACLDACPTDAFPRPYVLDATKCISYLTIELREQVPEPLREGIGDWVFGCDVCQDVCPWNHRVPPSGEPAFAAREDQNPLELAGLFYLTDAQFRARFRKTPLWRSKRRGILRNAAIVLGNQLAATASAALRHGLEDPDPLVQESCAWALQRIAQR